MGNRFDEPHGRARLPTQLSREKSALQEALLESVKLLKRDVLHFAHEWQSRWENPVLTQKLGEYGDTLLLALAGLEDEFSRPAGPAQPQVDGLLATLLGTQDAPGPLARLQRLTGKDPAALSLQEQRLLSEVDQLFIQINGLRAQWQNYLSLAKAAPSERPGVHQRSQPELPPLPPNQKTYRPTSVLPPLQRGARRDQEPEDDGLPTPPAATPPPVRPVPRVWQGWTLPGLGGLARALLPILLVLVVMLFLAYELANRLPKTEGHPTVSVTAHPTTALPTTQQPTSAPTVIITPSPQPIVTPLPVPGQLSVSPSSLLLPCPGTGAATLQLANIGATALDWQVTISSASGGAPGILLDGAPSENGQLAPGEVNQISVTAQALNAQGTLNVSYSGASAPIAVAYSVTC